MSPTLWHGRANARSRAKREGPCTQFSLADILVLVCGAILLAPAVPASSDLSARLQGVPTCSFTRRRCTPLITHAEVRLSSTLVVCIVHSQHRYLQASPRASPPPSRDTVSSASPGGGAPMNIHHLPCSWNAVLSSWKCWLMPCGISLCEMIVPGPWHRGEPTPYRSARPHRTYEYTLRNIIQADRAGPGRIHART